MQAGKKVYAGLSAGEAALFTQLTSSPIVLTTLLGLGELLPAYNLVISNVPGSRKAMYWNGAHVEGVYPASIVLHGQALNITLVSYMDQLDFGIIACRRSLPHVQRLLDHLEDSLLRTGRPGRHRGGLTAPGPASIVSTPEPAWNCRV